MISFENSAGGIGLACDGSTSTVGSGATEYVHSTIINYNIIDNKKYILYIITNTFNSF